MSVKKALKFTPKAEPTATPEITANGSSETKKFTLNIQSSGAISLTIRTDDKAEALALLDELKAVVAPPRVKKPYLKQGDPCPAENCDGFMTQQKGRNRKTGHEYDFLGCSNWPGCEQTAYIAKENGEGT
ncbi:MAG TPA: hypothetical protein VFD58_05760 [Blastocatellia bacterium]|nr:hypothetical protein [Blastocatellia bacterium]